MKIYIDKDTIKERCEEFFDLYHVTSGRMHEMCLSKIFHTRVVAQNCYCFAQKEGLSDYDCDLAWVIGELHDFARFGQVVVTKGFKDTDKFNHAKLGARILFTHGLVEDIIPDYSEMDEEDKLVLEKAVYYHSSYQLPEGLTDRETLFCNIIRQSDQLDIFRTIVESGWYTIYGCEESELLATDISDVIAEAFYNKKLADYSKRVTYADFHMAHIALCFGLQTRASRQIALEQGYILKMMDITFSNETVQQKFSKLKKITTDFLNS